MEEKLEPPVNSDNTVNAAHTRNLAHAPEPDVIPKRVPWGAVALYTVLACGLAWAATLPLWLGDGLESPFFTVSLLGMMYTPTIAALVCVFFVVRPSHKARYLGLIPFRPIGKKIALFLLWPVIWLALGFAAFFVAAALGWVEPDWAMTSFAALIPAGVSVEQGLIISFATLPITIIIATMSAFGEELGWRGFLTTALAPLGFWRSALISGVIWGVWHAPIILLGYNFMRPNLEGLAWMCGFTLFVGVLLQWSRYWTRNVWPAAAGHGALNAVTTMTFIWMPKEPDPAVATLLGAPGWIVMGAAILVLFGIGILGRGSAKTLR